VISHYQKKLNLSYDEISVIIDSFGDIQYAIDIISKKKPWYMLKSFRFKLYKTFLAGIKFCEFAGQSTYINEFEKELI
jgi:hypothetical protein